jgi:hypothetical protein
VYLGYMISGGELNIDHANMETVLKWLFPSNVNEFRIFFGAS